MGDLVGEKRNSAVLVWKHLASADSEAEVDLFRTLVKAIVPGHMPKIEDNVGYTDNVDLWTRKNDGKMVDDELTVQLRYVGKDANLLGAPAAFWPPPLELGTRGTPEAEGASVCWLVKFPGNPEKSRLLEWARAKAGWRSTTWFRRGKYSGFSDVRCSRGLSIADEKGRPTCELYLKALGVSAEERITFEIEWGDSLKVPAIYAPQCAICLERPLCEPSHDHHQCPLVATLNKIRDHEDLKPLRFNKGIFVRKDEKVDLDIDKVVRDLVLGMTTLKERVDAMEATAKASAPAPPAAQGKKRKGEGQQGGQPSKKPKKGKGGAGQGQAKGQQGGGKGGQDKGKGKA